MAIDSRSGESVGGRTLVVCMWAVLVLAVLPVREVIPPDEPRFTHQAQLMKEDGDWIVPKIGGIANADKPPGLFWAINVASTPLVRVNEITARMPSALAALVVLLLTVRLGRRLFGSESVGVGGAMILLTGIEFLQKAQWVSCDMLMTASAFVALTCWREALFEDEGKGRVPLGWLAAGFAVLTKGPVGLFWPLFWLIGEAAARRRHAALLRILHPAGIAGFALMVGGWLYAFGARAGGDYLHQAVFTQTLSRYASAWNSVQPWYFYLWQLPADLLPWSFLLPGVLALVIAGWRRSTGEAFEPVALRASAIFAVIGLAFFSGSSGKRGVYLLPVFPALSLLACAAFLAAGRPGGISRSWRSGALAAMAGLGVIVALLAVGASFVPVGGLREIGSFMRAWELASFAAGGFALAAGAVGAFRLAAQDRPEAALRSAVGGVALLSFVMGTAGGAGWSRHQGGREYGRRVASFVPPGDRIAIERGKFELILFYADRKGTETETDEQLARALQSGGCSFAILKSRRYAELRDRPPFSDLAVLDEAPLSSSTFVLLGTGRGATTD